MRKIEELTKDDCRKFLMETFENKNIEFSRLIFRPDFTADESCGIEYNVKNGISSINEQKYVVSFSNPEFLMWLYKNGIDITMPLEQLKYDFAEIDEANSVLFEFAMGVSKIVTSHSTSAENDEDVEKLNEIKSLQKELINKL
jgi:hypothetical protein